MSLFKYGVCQKAALKRKNGREVEHTKFWKNILKFILFKKHTCSKNHLVRMKYSKAWFNPMMNTKISLISSFQIILFSFCKQLFYILHHSTSFHSSIRKDVFCFSFYSTMVLLFISVIFRVVALMTWAAYQKSLFTSVIFGYVAVLIWGNVLILYFGRYISKQLAIQN